MPTKLNYTSADAMPQQLNTTKDMVNISARQTFEPYADQPARRLAPPCPELLDRDPGTLARC